MVALIFLLEMVGGWTDAAAFSGMERRTSRKLDCLASTSPFASSRTPVSGGCCASPHALSSWKRLGREGALAALLLPRRGCPGCWSACWRDAAATCTRSPRSMNWTVFALFLLTLLLIITTIPRFKMYLWRLEICDTGWWFDLIHLLNSASF